MISIVKKAVMVMLILLIGTAGQMKAQFAEPNWDIIRLILAEQTDKARKQIDGMLKADPKNPEAHFLSGAYYFELEEYENAKEAFSTGIKSKSKYPYNHIGLARTYNELGMKDERNASLAGAEKLISKKQDLNVMLYLAPAYIEAKEANKADKDKWLKKAEIVLYEVREKAPDDPRGWMRLGDYYQEKGIDELAKVNYEKAIEIDENFIRGYMRLGEINIREKNWNEGLKYLNTAINKEPELAPPYKERGELYLKAGEYEKARDDYKKYVSLLPNDTRSQLRYASFLYLTEDYQQALDILSTIDTVTLVKQRLLGYCYAETGELDKAEAAMDEYFKMIGDNPDKILPDDYEAVATVYLAGKNDEKAVEYYEKMFLRAIERGSMEEKYGTADEFYEGLAKTYRKEKDYAREAFYRQQMINSKSGVSLNDYFNLGLAHFRAEDYTQAEEVFNKVIEIKDDWEGGWYWLGSTQYKMTPDSKEWPAADSWMKVYELLKEKPVADLKKSEKSHMETVSAYLAFKAFNPDQPEEPTENDLHCEDALPFVEKVLEVNPENSQVKQITNYCEELRKVQGGR